MVHAVIYGMRGWIAFVAFIEFSNAIRCFLDDQFLTKIFVEPQNLSPLAARLFGRYFLLNGVIMLHCALFIHHLPVISMSICSLSLIIILHLSETLYYFASVLNFYTIFPIFISLSTIGCLIVAPFFLEDASERRKTSYAEDEEEESEDDEVNLIKKERQTLGKRGVPTSSTRKLKTN